MSGAVRSVPEREDASRLHLALSCLAIATGGLLLAVQIDSAGHLVGTGFATLGIGALVALIASLVQAGATGSLPRTTLQLFSTGIGFFGLASLVSGVLAPGGSWMFFEVALLLWALARRRDREQARWPEISRNSLVLIGALLLFRLWITYQGSRHAWEVVSIDVPLLSSIDVDWLAPVQSISLGSFTPHELGFPPDGIDFPLTTCLWALGFALCAVGLAWRNQATREVENDRIHDLIHTLPPGTARLVERLLPEEEWEELGLHGRPERALARRIEALVGERLQRERAIRRALDETTLELGTGLGAGFASEITRAVVRFSHGDDSAS